MDLEDTYKATENESQNDAYDLIVVGADKKHSAQNAWLQKQDCYVLVLHGKKKQSATQETEENDFEMRVSIEKV